MSVNQDLESLYNKWRNEGSHFVSGGVIDEQMFDTAEVKMMMLLKEVNDTEQVENWSLVKLIQDQIERGQFYPTWKRVGEWSFGLEQGFPYYQKIYEYNIPEGLINIATTNLKKSGGSGESDNEIIKNHAIEDKELWTNEIEIIQPDVVICGGTFPIVQDILKFDVQSCGSGALFGRALNTTFIGFYHPQYRISPKVLYSYFKETMQSLGY